MKRLFLLLLLALSSGSPAQEYFAEMSDRASSLQPKADVLPQIRYSFLKENVVYVKNQSLYSSSGERLTQNLLIDSGNEDIIRLVKKAKKNRKREFVAFAAVPLGVMAAACIRQGQLNYNWTKPVGISFLTASLTCIIVSPIACQRKTSNYRKAVKLYNTQF